MKYLVHSFGYATENVNIFTDDYQKALKILKKQVKKWCEENEIDINDTEYEEGDYSFQYGIEERGVCVFEIFNIPEFKNKIDELIWKAEFNLVQAENAATDYEYCLMDMDVDTYTWKVKEYLREIKSILDKEDK